MAKRKVNMFEDDLVDSSSDDSGSEPESETKTKGTNSTDVNDNLPLKEAKFDFDTLKKHGYTESAVLTETPEFGTLLEKEKTEIQIQELRDERERQRLAALAEEEKELQAIENQRQAEEDQSSAEREEAINRAERAKQRAQERADKKSGLLAGAEGAKKSGQVDQEERLSGKERVKRQRLAGQSGIGEDFKGWKSEGEMLLRQQFD
ncbi:hypothetical protein SARC_10463 [Sphaeroforma arctica JP610]|uniref:Uncharacterized protein n=1 Tax=Sphaeroforma arctica JP610 TaxID=667725 RepID=A0A0L0FK05_9EUKA|nr:hypothetical protein SARC_10463 [Sphaeroforma arctica JP610]KNC77070.1 hypothetical protein SARC_10463 [Sphaeroforma arctica JP610]|eukprot:XP_014150972.1 hypothetical protein SARC_10463 [Sphaeroforma arctica JP610]